MELKCRLHVVDREDGKYDISKKNGGISGEYERSGRVVGKMLDRKPVKGSEKTILMRKICVYFRKEANLI
jgi:hypothetical protein